MRNAPHEHQTLLRTLLQTNDADKVEKIRNLILPSQSIQFTRLEPKTYMPSWAGTGS